MSSVTIPNSFSASTKILSALVNGNFTTLANFINATCVKNDAANTWSAGVQTFSGAVTAAAGIGVAIVATPVVTAAANADAIGGLYVAPTFVPGAFTGLGARGIAIGAFSTAAFTSPAAPAMLAFGILNGTGATNAYGILIAPPVGATNNYLIAHTTAATFSVTAAGALVCGSVSPTGQILSAYASGPAFRATGNYDSAQIQLQVTAVGLINIGIKSSDGSGIWTSTGATDTITLRTNGDSGVTTLTATQGGGVGFLNLAGASSKYQVAGTTVVGARATGWTVMTGSIQRGTFATSTVTLAQLAGLVMALETDLIAHGLIGA